MEQSASEALQGKTLVDALVELGTFAFDPSTPASTKASHRKALDDLVQRTRTVAIMAALNKLIAPGRVPGWLATEFMGMLTSLPLRPDGVRATIEFVFAVHPSSTVGTAEAARPPKDGANITQEAMTLASRLLSTPPSTVSPESWFAGLAPQLLKLLDGQDGFDLIKVASHVIGSGILGRKKFGAPGSPGWVNLAEPILNRIDPSVSSTAQPGSNGRDDEIVDLSRDITIVSAKELSRGLHRLQALVISHPNPGLTRRLLGPILLPLWAMASWTRASAHCEELSCLPARNLLKIHLRLATSPDKLRPIIRNLLFRGRQGNGRQPWTYQETSSGELQIINSHTSTQGDMRGVQVNADEIEPKSDALINLIESISTDDEISSVCLDLFSRWLTSRRTSQRNEILIKTEEEADDPLLLVLEGSVLQKMMESFPDKLATRAQNLLELVEGFLKDGSAVDDESLAVALSLLNLVVTAPGFRMGSLRDDILESIRSSLDEIGKDSRKDTATTARNLSLFLRYRDKLEEQPASATAPTDRQAEDRKTYNLAMSYITAPDSPPPVKSEGLNLLQGLIHAHSPVLDVPATLVLMSSLLDENEDYINLRVIKIFTQLADKHPKTTTRELIDRYVDANEAATVDARLRFGEALLQVTERLGETFAGETARQVGEALLSVAGRRAHRSRTEAGQAREERLQSMKQRRGLESDDGPIPGMDDEETNEEKTRNSAIQRIIDGWGSKRGSEDIRIRASALSILAAGIESNIGGLGAALVSAAVDLCVNILVMELSLELGILRRAAVLGIMSFVRALDGARQSGKRLGFGLTQKSQEDILRVLRYVADMDNDELVKLHAQDVIESLENWQMSSVMPNVQATAPSLMTRLAGLPAMPSQDSRPDGTTRPKIEEVE